MKSLLLAFTLFTGVASAAGPDEAAFLAENDAAIILFIAASFSARNAASSGPAAEATPVKSVNASSKDFMGQASGERGVSPVCAIQPPPSARYRSTRLVRRCWRAATSASCAL